MGCQGDKTDAGAQWTHTVKMATEYYTGGPQQSRPPDGQLPPGTKVKIVEDAGSYVLVDAENGVNAFVSASALEEVR